MDVRASIPTEPVRLERVKPVKEKKQDFSQDRSEGTKINRQSGRKSNHDLPGEQKFVPEAEEQVVEASGDSENQHVLDVRV